MNENSGEKHRTIRDLAKKTHEMLRSMAHQDPLTGLLNRRGVINMSEQIIRNLERENLSPSFTVVMLDMIGLKALNIKHGESGADKKIKDSADAISKNVRESDIVGRWGGDEFAIVAFDTDSNGTKMLIDKVKMSQPEEVYYNAVFRVYGSGKDVGEALAEVFNSIEEMKKGLPKDTTGRSIGTGVTKELNV